MKWKSDLLIQEDKHDKVAAPCLHCSSGNQFHHNVQQKTDVLASDMCVRSLKDEPISSH